MHHAICAGLRERTYSDLVRYRNTHSAAKRRWCCMRGVEGYYFTLPSWRCHHHHHGQSIERQGCSSFIRNLHFKHFISFNDSFVSANRDTFFFFTFRNLLSIPSKLYKCSSKYTAYRYGYDQIDQYVSVNGTSRHFL